MLLPDVDCYIKRKECRRRRGRNADEGEEGMQKKARKECRRRREGNAEGEEKEKKKGKYGQDNM